MKLYALPTEVPAPKFDFKDGIEHYDTLCDNHRQDLKTWLIQNGWFGKNTGRTVSFSVADGSAEYMIAQAGPRSGRSTSIFHLPYLDGYHYRGAEKFSFKELLEMADSAEKLAAHFRNAKRKPLEATARTTT